MGSFSIWHWFIVLIVFAIPVFVVVWNPPTGLNRFGVAPEGVDFGQAIALFFRKYADFEGRASRSEFWYTALFLVGVNILLSVADSSEDLAKIFNLGVFIPSIAQNARHLHDINRSGWSQLILLCGPVGFLVLLVWYIRKSQENDYVVPGSGVPKGGHSRFPVLK